MDEIVMLDFITSYAADFGVADHNLHGNNENKESEYTARRTKVQDAISYLVMYGLLNVREEPDGFLYEATDEGNSLCDGMTTSYAADYMAAAIKAGGYMMQHNVDDILSQINRKSKFTSL